MNLLSQHAGLRRAWSRTGTEPSQATWRHSKRQQVHDGQHRETNGGTKKELERTRDPDETNDGDDAAHVLQWRQAWGLEFLSWDSSLCCSSSKGPHCFVVHTFSSTCLIIYICTSKLMLTCLSHDLIWSCRWIVWSSRYIDRNEIEFEVSSLLIFWSFSIGFLPVVLGLWFFVFYFLCFPSFFWA